MNAPAQARKARRITSEQIDQSKPAAIIVAKAGGLSNFAREYDFPLSTVQSWMVSGFIPSRRRQSSIGEVSYQAWILHRSGELGHKITAGDFIENPAAAA